MGWHHGLLSHIQSLLRCDRRVHVQHVFREGNACPDWLANRSLQLSLGLHRVMDRPVSLKALIFADIIGVSVPRFCSL